MNDTAPVKPKEGIYKTVCPYCDARLMSGRSLLMRTGINVGTGHCPSCDKTFVQRLVGDSQAMETCKMESDLNEKWHDEAFNPKPISPHLETVD